MDITKADVNNWLLYAVCAFFGGTILYILYKLVKAAFFADDDYTRSDARFWLLVVILCILGVVGFAWYMSLPATRSLQ